MTDVTFSRKKVIAKGFVNKKGKKQNWDDLSMSLCAVADKKLQIMVSPFEWSLLVQYANDLAVDNKPSYSRTGRIILRKALGLDE